MTRLKKIVQDQPAFETAVLLAGDAFSPYQVQKQLSDWAKAGKVVQLRRGVYTLPGQKAHPFVIANHLVPGSYVSLQIALGYYHLIPEHVAVITNVTTGRPGQKRLINTLAELSAVDVRIGAVEPLPAADFDTAAL